MLGTAFQSEDFPLTYQVVNPSSKFKNSVEPSLSNGSELRSLRNTEHFLVHAHTHISHWTITDWN